MRRRKRKRKQSGAAFSLFAFQDIITSVTGIMLLITMMLALELIKKKEESPPEQTQKTTESVQSAVAANQNEILQLRATLSATDEQLRYDEETLRRKLSELSSVNEIVEQQLKELEQREQDTEKRKQEMESALSQTVSPQQVQQMQERLKELQEQLLSMKNSNRVIFNRPVGDAKSPWLIEVSGNEIRIAEVGVAAPPKVFPHPDDARDWISSQNKGSVYFVVMVKPSGLDKFSLVKQDLESLEFEIGYDLLAEDQQAIDSETGAGVNE